MKSRKPLSLNLSIVIFSFMFFFIISVSFTQAIAQNSQPQLSLYPGTESVSTKYQIKIESTSGSQQYFLLPGNKVREVTDFYRRFAKEDGGKILSENTETSQVSDYLKSTLNLSIAETSFQIEISYYPKTGPSDVVFLVCLENGGSVLSGSVAPDNQSCPPEDLDITGKTLINLMRNLYTVGSPAKPKFIPGGNNGSGNIYVGPSKSITSGGIDNWLDPFRNIFWEIEN